MINTSLNTKNKIYLQDPRVNETSYSVSFSVLNELGAAATDNEEVSIEDNSAIFDNVTKQWYAEFILSASSKGKYYRLVFGILDKSGSYMVSDAALVDLIIQRTTSSIQLVPPAFFRDYVINQELDDDIKEAVSKYPMDALTEWLLSANGELEHDIELSFTPKTIENEPHDWFQDNFYETHWMINLFHMPIISVQAYYMYYGTEKVCEILPEYLTLGKEMGIVEYLPINSQPFSQIFFTMGIEATQLSLMARGWGASRLPNVFRVSYTHGLDFLNLEETEQSSIRMAICRRAMLNGLPRISPEVIKGSKSSSADGVSYSETNRGIEWLNIAREADVKYVLNMKRRYNTALRSITI